VAGVRLTDGVEGLVPVGDTGPPAVGAEPTVGDETDVVVTRVVREGRRMLLAWA